MCYNPDDTCLLSKVQPLHFLYCQLHKTRPTTKHVTSIQSLLNSQTIFIKNQVCISLTLQDGTLLTTVKTLMIAPFFRIFSRNFRAYTRGTMCFPHALEIKTSLNLFFACVRTRSHLCVCVCGASVECVGCCV